MKQKFLLSFVVLLVGVGSLLALKNRSSQTKPSPSGLTVRRTTPASLLTSEPFVYPSSPGLDKAFAKLDAMPGADPFPKYVTQMGLIVGQRLSDEDGRCRAAGMPFAEKKKRMDAVLEAGEKEKKRVMDSRFTKPFNVHFPVQYPDGSSGS